MLTRFDPFAELNRFRDELFRDAPPRAFTPAVDIFEDAEALTVKAELPGVKVDDVKIDVENNILTLRGERKFDVDRKAVALGVGLRYRGAQLRNAERHGVTQLIGRQRLDGRRPHGFGGTDTGLAGGQVDQIAVGALTLGGGEPHVHDVERRDAGPQCGLHQAKANSVRPTRGGAGTRSADRTAGRCRAHV